ncbi:1,2-phenylacetyl-CoA epoxidase PaaB subunit [Chryseobacterium sp. SORGH_AS 447]|uniref:hypothetical protein n=1 Tax=Chryseobacterium sp. SORGH_AS_0447 TaxID=3041769 RepID=UPI00278603B3|nr:hypothetical protein [Chryseobacterium sp. SORGH_AS_0447]MDQ1160451.1 1,2-phenylacetyl-CoA epoxidase PaaB subunit [Chryseobacterium sp. SORGH_AS_0447]
MKEKILFILLLVININIDSQIFKEPYYFVGPDEMHVYKKSNDTLYTSTAFSVKLPETTKYREHYKIWSVKENPSDITIMKLENLDSIPLTTDPYPEDRFRIFVFKKNSEKEAVLINDIGHLTKQELANYNTDTIQSKKSIGMKLYSLSYMKELMKLKKVVSKSDVDKINNELNNPKYLNLIEDYKKENKLFDPYASILAADLINTACLNLGYSPIGASFSMNIINSDKKEKEKIIKEFYKRLSQ